MDVLMSAPISDRDDRDRDLRRAPSPPRLGALRIAVGASVLVHSALVMAAVLLPAYVPAEVAAPMVMVDVVAEVPIPEIVPPPEPPAAPANPIVTRRAAPRSPVAVKPQPLAAPSPAEQPPSEVAPVVAAAPDQTTGDGPAVLVAMAPAGLPGGKAAGHGSGDLGPRGQTQPLTEAQRISMIGRYRDVLRNRIQDRFRYPAEATEMELVGQVVVQITVDKGGRLLSSRLRGACPHPLLCDDALRTVRAAAPFAPLPRDVGESLPIDVPLNYAFK